MSKLLLKAIRRKVTPPLEVFEAPQPNKLLQRMNTLKKLDTFKDEMFLHIKRLHFEVLWIRWLTKHQGSLDFAELQLAVERYPGRSPWWLDIENSYYLEKQFRSAPKLENYNIGNYWEQVEYYEKHGTAEVPGVNTEQFILDRAKWVYKHIGRQIHVARRLLWIAKNWNFTDEQTAEFEKLYNRLGVY